MGRLYAVYAYRRKDFSNTMCLRTGGFDPQGCLAVVDDSQEENVGPPAPVRA